jgi:hypothetical protein
MMASHAEVHRVTFNIEDMLDWRCSALTLRQDAEERAWTALPDDQYSDDLQTELEIDGQHVIVKFMGPQGG